MFWIEVIVWWVIFAAIFAAVWATVRAHEDNWW